MTSFNKILEMLFRKFFHGGQIREAAILHIFCKYNVCRFSCVLHGVVTQKEKGSMEISIYFPVRRDVRSLGNK